MFWNKPEKVTSNTDAVTKFWVQSNEIFKVFLNDFSWILYSVAAFLITGCIWFFIQDYRKRLDLQGRRENFHRANERIPQRRRPGAICRNHAIFRNAVKTVHQYTGSAEKKESKGQSYDLKRTRSGAAYGSFSGHA